MSRKQCCLLLATFVGAVVSMSTPFNRKIVFDTDTSPLADYAARETRRYLWLTTGSRSEIVDSSSNDYSSFSDETIFVGSVSTAYKRFGFEFSEHSDSEPFAVRRMGSVVCLTGKDKTHMLYAVWSFAEMPGDRFELHGDIIPDPTIELPYARYAHAPLPIENALVTKTPVFAYR